MWDKTKTVIVVIMVIVSMIILANGYATACSALTGRELPIDFPIGK